MLRSVSHRLLIAYVWAVVAVLLAGWVVRVDDGPLGILAVFAPHLALAGLVLVPLAALIRSRRLGLAIVVLALVFGARFGGEWWSFPPPIATAAPSGEPVRSIDVVTWNVEAGAAAGSGVVEMLHRHPVDVVVLEELTPGVAQAIEADRVLLDRYPYRELRPDASVSGMGILSAFPLSDPAFQSPPIRLETTLDVDGRPVVVIGAHPFHADVDLVRGIPIGLVTATRNTDLELLRHRVLELDVRDQDVVLLGDFNTAPTEPAFSLLTSGLHDAHAEVGVGPGWTWRPARLEFLGIGLLRIDLVLSTGRLAPQRVAVDCPAVGDHCLVDATLALAR